MDDAQLWQDMRAGAPVAHCRAKIAHDQAQTIARRNQDAVQQFLLRNPALALRLVAGQ